MTKQELHFDFDNTYARDLEGFYVPWRGGSFPSPETIVFNEDLAGELGLGVDAAKAKHLAGIFSGTGIPKGAAPLAQAYAGHQFGGFSAQLGDGRAMLLGEIIDKNGRRHDLQLKGSGKTPFSRGGDGKAALGPVLREYLMGEAMNALGVPTTRALAAVTTGEEVVREGMKRGAVLARIASSHLRVGTFQFFAARKEWDKVQQLADYAIERHFPEISSQDNKYLRFLEAVANKQAALIAKWVQVGFVHGVMNTDNMTISGETIDYGPCAFIDAYDPKAVFSSIDRDGRYSFGNQPIIAQWNLTRLAETLLPLIDTKDNDNAVRLATNVVNGFPAHYAEIWQSGVRVKIGLASSEKEDDVLINKMFAAMEGQNVDFTQFFRRLAKAADGKDEGLLALFDNTDNVTNWLVLWRDRLLRDPQNPSERVIAMNAINPVYIPRNHNVEAALISAEEGDMVPFLKLLDVLSAPFAHQKGLGAFEGPAPDDFGPYKTFCGT